MNPKVDEFLNKVSAWSAEFRRLRALMLEVKEFTEEFKWGQPCYAFKGKNVALIHGFKDYCAVLFIKGALVEDPQHLLVAQTEEVQAARQMRFKNLQDILDREEGLRACLRSALEVEKSGKQVEMKAVKDYTVCPEFQDRLAQDPALKTAFEALTPGRQKAYLLHFSQAKQSQTRLQRIEKHAPRILAAKGLDDV